MGQEGHVLEGQGWVLIRDELRSQERCELKGRKGGRGSFQD